MIESSSLCGKRRRGALPRQLVRGTTLLKSSLIVGRFVIFERAWRGIPGSRLEHLESFGHAADLAT